MAISTKEIGDFKTPNRYWVSVSENYYIFDQEECASEWISDKLKIDSKGATLKVFPSFRMAQGWIENNLYLGINFNDIICNSITIEDRISGELFHWVKELFPKDATITESRFVDTRFTEEEMKKRGLQFV